MSDYKATPEQWVNLERRQLGGNDLVCAALELRARVEALEANHPEKPDSSDPAGSLVERVMGAMAKEDWMNSGLYEVACQDSDPTYRYTSAAIDDGLDVGCLQARASIREVTAWLRSQCLSTGDYWAERLEQEAER